MCSLLVRDATIITMEGGANDVLRGDILVEDDIIVAVSAGLDPGSAEVMDGRGFIVIPGLVNAHMHTWQTALRSIASNWSLPEYLRRMHAGLATAFRPRDIYSSTVAGAWNQLNSGTTTLVDWCHNNPTPEHTDAAIEALRTAGIRAAFFHGTPKPDPRPGERPYWEASHPRHEVIRLRNALANGTKLLTLGLAILGPDYANMDVALKDFELALEFDLIASMHQGGGVSRNPDGWALLRDRNLLGSHVNIVHGTGVSDAILTDLAGRGATFTVTPETEMTCGHGDPIIGKLRARGVEPSIGADIESAHSSDMLTAARIALCHQRAVDHRSGRSNDNFEGREGLTVRDALAWITIEGARMLRQEDRIGSIAAGKQADLVFLDATGLNLQPIHDPISSVILQANASNIDSVMVAGRWRKRAGRLLWSGMEEAIEELNAVGQRIRRDAHARMGLVVA